MHRDSKFRYFEGWASGYFACSVSPEERMSVIEYINGQEEHHLHHRLEDEFRRLYSAVGIDYDERDMQ